MSRPNREMNAEEPRTVLKEVERWLSTRSWSMADRPLHKIMAAKRATHQTVSVVLPALNEEETVGDIVAIIRHDLMRQVPLVDEIVVVDSGSTDRTSEVAAAAGARVVHRDDILPRMPTVPGKGEVLWRSLLVTSGDIVCFIDADLKEFSSDFVSGIVGPLLTDPGVDLVKAMYDRPLGSATGQGGRVTELMARPCSTCTGPSWPASSSRSAASTRPAAPSWSSFRSRSATAWSWACWSTRCIWSAWTPCPRSTWASANTGTRTGRPSAVCPRRSIARPSSGWPAAT